VAKPGPFEVLGLPLAFAVDTDDLRRRLLRFSRMMHPDYFAAAEPELRALAERNSAELNRAHEILSDDGRRADYLVTRLGGPSESEQRQMPQEFLMEVLEWNETLDDARGAGPGSPERAALDTLESALRTARTQTLADVAGGLTPLPEPGSAALFDTRKRLNGLRYLNKTLNEIAALRLEEATTR
jgi:molecular chaperone HscB